MSDMGARILIIDDKLQVRRLLKVAIAPHGYEIREASGGVEGLEQVPAVC